MNKLVRNMRLACFALMFLLTACFRDGLEECPPGSEYYSYIKFVYDYNMSFEDLFHRQVSNVDVYLFNSDGVYLQKLVDQVPEGSTFSRQYLLGLPEEYKDVVQFVAFAGLHDEQTRVSTMLPGQSTISDFRVALNENITTTNLTLKPLWYGGITLPRTRAAIERNDTTIISLVKNTNTIRVALQSLDDDITVDVKDFSFCMQAVNHNYDAYNITTGSDFWNYVPYEAYNDQSSGTIAVAELQTMRLLADRDNRLIIDNVINGTNLLDVNLNTYINALKFQKYSEMPLQEYMDREDEYTIMIFVTRSKEEPETNKWEVARISINSWIVRDQGQVGID